MKEKIISLLRSTERSGINKLIAYLESTDFYHAPASTNYHGACRGGLIEHSFAVYETLAKINMEYKLGYNKETVIISGLLHDICKANFYKIGYRNRKNEDNGVWEKIQVYEIDDQFPVGHGEKSVILLQKFIMLTEDEIMAIRWHMGGFDNSAQGFGGMKSLSAAMKNYKLVVALHMADLAASYFDGK